MIHAGLLEPGQAGTYDAETSIAGFDFPADSLQPFFEPGMANWRQLLAGYHEWIHHYQYHATTYGYLYRIIANSQLLLTNGILRVVHEERGRRRVSLPLASRTVPLAESTAHPNDLNQRMVTILQTQRDGVLGFGPHPSPGGLNEYVLAGKLLTQQFGGPRVVVLEPEYMPQPPAVRYPIRTLLETQAHLLSTNWLMLAVDRMDGDRRIVRAALDYANEQLIGPYAGFVQVAGDLPGGADRLKMFCALAEVALNPPGIHRHPQLHEDTLITPGYTSWFPVVRMETLIALTLQGLIPWPSGAWPDAGGQLLESVSDALIRSGDMPSTFLPATQGERATPALQRVVDRVIGYAADEDDVPPVLLAFLLDAMAKLLIAEDMRTRSPLLMPGFVIEELRHLVLRIGGPTSYCDDGPGARTLIGACTGLMHLELLSPGTVQIGSDLIVTQAAPIVQTLLLLLTRSRAELEARQDEPVIRGSQWTLRSVLADNYALELSDFD